MNVIVSCYGKGRNQLNYSDFSVCEHGQGYNECLKCKDIDRMRNAFNSIKSGKNGNCEHNRSKYRCIKCHDMGRQVPYVCEHRRYKYTCNFCQHERYKYNSNLCKHNCYKYGCNLCRLSTAPL